VGGRTGVEVLDIQSEMKKKIPRPPRLAQWVLKVFFTDRGDFTHLGDFTQVFNRLVRREGPRRARLWFWGQTLEVLPWILSNKIYWSLVMFRNYLVTAFRNLFKSRGFSVINIAGLSVGMAACILILMFIRDELSYDAYHENGDRIYRLAVDYKLRSEEARIATVGASTAVELVSLYPEVENAVRFRVYGDLVVQHGQKSFREPRAVYVDPSFFDIFSIPLVAGDQETVLDEPFSAVLTRETAVKYFGTEDVLGRTLLVENRDDYKVTGIIDRIPDNSHFHFDMLMSMSSTEESRSPDWLSLNFQTYLLLSPDVDPQALEAKLPDLVFDRVGKQLQQITGFPPKLIFASGVVRFRYFLQPLRDIHLHSHLMVEFEPNSDIKYIYIFSVIALFILVIASINFVNLTTARSAGRAKEVGVRKVLGSQRAQLIRQFSSESIFFSLLSMLLALLIVSLFLPLFNHLSGKHLSLSHLGSLVPIALIVLMALVTGLFSSLYPSLLLSGFSPSRVLKGDLQHGMSSRRLRSALVIFQFAASIILIIGTIVIYRQLHFIQNKKLGYEKEQVLVMDNAMLLGDSIQSFKKDMLNNPDFRMGTVSSYLPVPSGRNAMSFFPEGDIQSTFPVQTWTVDHGYIPTLGMSVVKGRNFSEEFSTDSGAVIINQTMARELEWDNPLGKRLSTILSEKGDRATYEVIGVVEDFHFESLRNDISPLALCLGTSPDYMSFRIGTEDVSQSITALRQKWEDYLPLQPFEYFFLDERFDTVYQAERRIGEIAGVFSGLALIIGCLGLLGLASFTAEQRTKEIGVRKILGASAGSIVKLLLREYFLLIALANAIAWPVAYFLMREWLREFAFRAPFSLWIPIAAGAAAAAIALFTVGFLALKTAVSNPAQSLRYE
jgi:putative ABC transport system permease protein